MAFKQVTLLDCPICPFSDTDENILTLHIEHLHFSDYATGATNLSIDSGKFRNENQRRYPVDDADFADVRGEPNPYLPCPESDCGEEVLWLSLQEHLDLHIAEGFNQDSPTGISSLSAVPKERASCGMEGETIRSSFERRTVNFSTTSSASAQRPAQQYSRQLGPAELGPHAFEKQMPSSLRTLLLTGATRITTTTLTPNGILHTSSHLSNETPHIIPLLSTLLSADSTVQKAWLCHESVMYVYKLPQEGGFCGYRNLQMMWSFLLAVGWEGSQNEGVLARRRGSKGSLPGVLDLQDMIEGAWDKGFDRAGRRETGGIRGTRKFIGTPEVQALFNSLAVPVSSLNFHDNPRQPAPSSCSTSINPPTTTKVKPKPKYLKAHEQLLSYVESYFTTVELSQASSGKKVIQTQCPPLYLQQPGHSLTIVGFEIGEQGEKNLLVLDPAFKPSIGIVRMLDGRTAKRSDGGSRNEPSKSGTGKNVGDSISRKSASSFFFSQTTTDKAKIDKKQEGLTSEGVVRKRQRSSSSDSGSSGANHAKNQKSLIESPDESRNNKPKVLPTVGTSSNASLANGNNPSDIDGEAPRNARRAVIGDGGSGSSLQSRGQVVQSDIRSRAGSGKGRPANKLLDAYRRGSTMLEKFGEFEIVALTL